MKLDDYNLYNKIIELNKIYIHNFVVVWNYLEYRKFVFSSLYIENQIL
jgi:hypothetical protein